MFVEARSPDDVIVHLTHAERLLLLKLLRDANPGSNFERNQLDAMVELLETMEIV